MFNFHTTYSRADTYGPICAYCDEPIGNEQCTDRGGFPIHPFCNQQLNEELMVWERESKIANCLQDEYELEQRETNNYEQRNNY